MAGDADEDQKEEEPPPDWGPAIRLVAGIAIPLLVLFTPVVVIVARKHRRRRRRLTAPLASSRVAGGWREIVDYATDLGTSVPGSATRAQSAGKLATSYNAGAVIALAEWADSAVFGGGEPDDAQVAAYWADVATARRQIGAAAGWWRRRRAAASLASLRRRPASRPDPASRQVKER
jgi:hypothetical protein